MGDLDASMLKPIYSVGIVNESGSFNITNCVTSLEITENHKELARKLKVAMANIPMDSGAYPSSFFKVRDRIFVYVDTGSGKTELFRGFIWDKSYKSGLNKDLTLVAYDHLIYLQKSEDYQYFPEGSSTVSICKKLMYAWGVSLDYRYESITHPKLSLRGTLANIVLSDLLDAVQNQTGKKYVVKSIDDVMYVDTVGQNPIVYDIKRGQGGNVISTDSKVSMDGVITKVIIIGSENNNKKAPVEAIVNGKTKEYGTLQKVINKNSDTKLEEAKKEANAILKDCGEPKSIFNVNALDNPWIRKGDKVNVTAGDMTANFMVLSITHMIDSGQMNIEMEKADL